jgi:hypothetical protein
MTKIFSGYTATARHGRFVHTSAGLYGLAILGLLVISGCSTESPMAPEPTPGPVARHNADVAVAWSDLQMSLIATTPGYTPPVAARALGYSGVALYQALVPGMPDYRSLAGLVNGLSPTPQPMPGEQIYWPAVANSALATITARLFASTSPTNLARIDSLERALQAHYLDAPDVTVLNRSNSHGRLVAEAVFEWSKGDGGHEGYLRNFPTDYTPPVGPGMWVPTPRPVGAPQPAMQPYWGSNRPFILTPDNPSIDNDPGAPPAYSEDPASECYRQAHEVYTTVPALSTEQRAIALFWSDDPGRTCTPAGHSISILNQSIRTRGVSLEKSAEAYARVGMAVSDGFVACWQVKYRYNVMRPITYIRTVIDSTWNNPTITDPLTTPPFPEYPSGHSVQSGAASAVLTSLYGEGFSFVDHTHDAAGMTARSFGSFDEFAREAAISRLYGGIHCRAAIENGLAQGTKIGRRIASLPLKVR